MNETRKVSVVITDLDDTLWDWVGIWHASFSALIDGLVEDSGVPREQLLAEAKEIHRRHGTSEYAFLVEELPSLQAKHPGENPAEIYRAAIEKFRIARCRVLSPYPGVLRTMREFKRIGVRVVAYTESMSFYTNWRIRRLGLDGLIDVVYSPRGHDLPDHLSAKKREKYQQEQELLVCTTHRTTPPGEMKPNPSLLLDIIRDVGATAEQCLYVGDKLFKDVAMALDAGVMAVHAKYGEAHQDAEYELLKQVTHWDKESVDREQAVHAGEVRPSVVLANGFDELLTSCQFEGFEGRLSGELSDKDVDNLLFVWKRTIEVQEHFNTVEMKIRNAAVTILAALLGAIGFAMKQQLAVDFFGYPFPIAAMLLIAALFAWGATVSGSVIGTPITWAVALAHRAPARRAYENSV